jgi:hypothetical protein
MDTTSCRSSGGKAGGTPGAWRVDQPVQSLAGEPLAPLPDPSRRPVHSAGDRPIAQPAPGEQNGPRPVRHPSPGASSPTQMLQYPPLAGRQSNRCLRFGPSPSRLPMSFLFPHATQDTSPRVGPEFTGQCTSRPVSDAAGRRRRARYVVESGKRPARTPETSAPRCRRDDDYDLYPRPESRICRSQESCRRRVRPMSLPAVSETICAGICCTALQPIAAREPYNRYMQVANSKVEKSASWLRSRSAYAAGARSICCITQVSLSRGRILVGRQQLWWRYANCQGGGMYARLR